MHPVRILHESPGRLRLALPVILNSKSRARACEDAIRNLPGVRHVHANERTASLLVLYAPSAETRAAIQDRCGRLRGTFRGLARNDEIGDLARALEQLTVRLEDRQRGLESFASDVAHELKNPLASIRSAAEMLSEVRDPEERRRFLSVVLEEVARMEQQVSQLAEVTRIDAGLEAEEQTAVPLNGLLCRNTHMCDRTALLCATSSIRIGIITRDLLRGISLT